MYSSYLSFNSPPTGHICGFLPPVWTIFLLPRPQSAFTPAEGSVTSCWLSCHRLAALLWSWAWAEGRQRKQLLKYMPPNPSSSGASAQYTVVAAPCCCRRRNTQRKRGGQRANPSLISADLPRIYSDGERGSKRPLRDTLRQKKDTPGMAGTAMVAWEEQKPKLYINNIYIHIFIYLFISLPSV